MKTFVAVIAILLIATFASANVLIESGVRPQRRAAACTHVSESGLPADHDWVTGYSEEWLDDETVVMYFTQPEVETDISRAFRAKTEGWNYGAECCKCDRKTEVGSPELRLNKVSSYDQRILLEYFVGKPALKWEIQSATLNMKYCYGYSGDLVVEAAVGMVTNDGSGDSYQHGCCTPYNYCNVAGACSYEIYEVCDAVDTYTQCMWYDWDITACAQKYQEQAPTAIWIIVYGTEGTGYYQRWCSTCNNPPGEEKCGPYVQVVARWAP